MLRLILAEIREAGPLSFARFMDLALNHPLHGYYASGPERLGSEGDFITAGDVGPAFGACLARQLIEMDGHLDRPDPFRYVEVGAGRGILAADVAAALANEAPDLSRRLTVALVDASGGMREAASRRVPGATVVADPGTVAGGAGCAVAVELLDALPVHRIRRRAEALVEIVVACEDGRLVEAEQPAGDALCAYAAEYGAAPADGDEAEACLVLGATLAALSGTIDRGFVVVVDYGHEASRMFGPAHRRGTLMAYHRHTAGEAYLARVGEQDLTAHVNLTALRWEAERSGLFTLGITTQDRFLIANGILAGLADDDGGALAATKRRLQAKQLLHPFGMGTAFKVAIFSKGLVRPPALRGVGDPFV